MCAVSPGPAPGSVITDHLDSLFIPWGLRWVLLEAEQGSEPKLPSLSAPAPPPPARVLAQATLLVLKLERLESKSICEEQQHLSSHTPRLTCINIHDPWARLPCLVPTLRGLAAALILVICSLHIFKPVSARGGQPWEEGEGWRTSGSGEMVGKS